MAAITLNDTSYTQINTDAADYLAQNLSGDYVYLIASATQPLITADPEIILKKGQAIGDGDKVAILWGMTKSPNGATVGLM